MRMLIIQLAILSAFVQCISGHGRMLIPLPRTDVVGTEQNPIGMDPTIANFACKGLAPQTPAVTLTAGTTLSLTTNIANTHVGDCSVYISYDSTSSNPTQWIKILNIPDCKKGNVDQVPIPGWLKPSAHAVLRWEWVALHNAFFGVEFYTNCADVSIVNPSGAGSEPDSYVTIPGHLPTPSSAYRDGSAPGPVTEAMMVGPPVARAASAAGGAPTAAPVPCTQNSQCASGVCRVEGVCLAQGAQGGAGGAIAAAVVFALLFAGCLVLIILKREDIAAGGSDSANL